MKSMKKVATPKVIEPKDFDQSDFQEYESHISKTKLGYRWVVYKALDYGVCKKQEDAQHNVEYLLESDLKVREENARRVAINRFHEGLPVKR